MSLLLVFLQFALILAIAAPVFPAQLPAMHPAGVILFGGGLAVFVLAFTAMRWKTFTVMPEPKTGGELVTRGIYALVRHPMYLAVLLCAAGACLAYGTTWKWWCAGLLALVLWMKIRREERVLAQRYAGYAAYRQRTRAILPFVL